MNGLVPSPAPSSAPQSRHRRQLRLVDCPAVAPSSPLPRPERTPKHANATVTLKRGHVLVVGVDADARAHMLSELRDVLPCGTRFVETQETWEALSLAEGSQMVVLVGDLEELSGASVVRLLARRQPALPVLAVGGEAAPAPPDAANG